MRTRTLYERYTNASGVYNRLYDCTVHERVYNRTCLFNCYERSLWMQSGGCESSRCEFLRIEHGAYVILYELVLCKILESSPYVSHAGAFPTRYKPCGGFPNPNYVTSHAGAFPIRTVSQAGVLFAILAFPNLRKSRQFQRKIKPSTTKSLIYSLDRYLILFRGKCGQCEKS